jgi:hypothetical protein
MGGVKKKMGGGEKERGKKEGGCIRLACLESLPIYKYFLTLTQHSGSKQGEAAVTSKQSTSKKISSLVPVRRFW